MDAAALPPSSTGYRVEELQQFLAAADQRIAALESEIAAANARRDAALGATPSGAEVRRSIADTWLAAQRDADAIRAAADADAKALLEHAARDAHAMQHTAIPEQA